MKNTLVIAIEPTFSLNFLIYLQNIYLNQNEQGKNLKHPYFPKQYPFKEAFVSTYEELWAEVSQKVSENEANDIKSFYDEKDLFYQQLFVINDESYDEFLEVYQSYKVWWDSFTGRFAIERFVSEDVEQLYKELANLLIERKVAPRKQLHISLLYDECQLAGSSNTPYYVILPINDFIIKSEELLPKLEQHIE